MYLPISFRVTSLALGQSYDCPSASEVTLKDMGKINKYQTTTKHKKTENKKIILGDVFKIPHKKHPIENISAVKSFSAQAVIHSC